MLATNPQEQVVLEPVEAFRHCEDLPWGVRSLRLAREIELALSDHDGFAAAVDLVASQLEARGIKTVLGASPLGQRLADAVADRLGVGIGPSAATAVIDAVANTGFQLAEAWRMLAKTGTTPIAAVVLVAQRDVLDAWASTGRRLEAVAIV